MVSKRKKEIRKVSSRDDYYALLCDTSKYEPKSVSKKYPPLICGVFATKQEAQKMEKEVNDCPAEHRIIKCQVTITYTPSKRKK